MNYYRKPNQSQIDCENYYNLGDTNNDNYLNMIPRNRILLHNDHYLVIDKPHDVRMDGDFNTTIEKLLIATIPNSNKDSFKWIHQLDYATSGALAIALNKESASIASLAFENRETSKVYLAILEGHVDTNKWKSIPFTQVLSKRASLNNKSKVSSTKPYGEKCTNKSFIKSISSWQDAELHTHLREHMKKLMDIATATEYSCNRTTTTTSAAKTNENHRNNGSYNDSDSENPLKLQNTTITIDQEELTSLLSLTHEDFSKYAKQRKRLRKFLKSCGVYVSLSSDNVAANDSMSDSQLNTTVNMTTTSAAIEDDDEMVTSYNNKNNNNNNNNTDFSTNPSSSDIKLDIVEEISNSLHKNQNSDLIKRSNIFHNIAQHQDFIHNNCIHRSCITDDANTGCSSTYHIMNSNSSPTNSHIHQAGIDSSCNPTAIKIATNTNTINSNTPNTSGNNANSKSSAKNNITPSSLFPQDGEVLIVTVPLLEPTEDFRMDIGIMTADGNNNSNNNNTGDDADGDNGSNSTSKSSNVRSSSINSSSYNVNNKTHDARKSDNSLNKCDSSNSNNKPNNINNKPIKNLYQAESWIRVLEYATYQNRPVTKVAMKLLTGRRHQLRVHCLCLGHPIVGDATYQQYDINSTSNNTGDSSNATYHQQYDVRNNIFNSSNKNNDAVSIVPSRNTPTSNGIYITSAGTTNHSTTNQKINNRGVSAERMMLHAFQLRIPLPSQYKPTRKSSSLYQSMYQHKIQAQVLIKERISDGLNNDCTSAAHDEFDHDDSNNNNSTNTNTNTNNNNNNNKYNNKNSEDNINNNDNNNKSSNINDNGHSSSYVSCVDLYLVNVQTIDPFPIENGIVSVIDS